MHQPFSSCQQAQPDLQQYHTGIPSASQTQAYTPGYDQNYYQYGDGTVYDPGYDYPQSYTSGWLNFSDPCYLKGLIIGAGLTFLLTNATVQRAIVRGAVSLTSTVHVGVEKVKEQINDIKAEISQKEG